MPDLKPIRIKPSDMTDIILRGGDLMIDYPRDYDWEAIFAALGAAFSPEIPRVLESIARGRDPLCAAIADAEITVLLEDADEMDGPKMRRLRELRDRLIAGIAQAERDIAEFLVAP